MRVIATAGSRLHAARFPARLLLYLPTVVFVSIVVYVTAYQPYNNGPPIRSDGRGYHVWTYALKKWDFRFCEYAAIGETGAALVPGRCVVKWPPGVALFRFPLMAWFVDVDNHESLTAGEHWVSLIFGAALTLAVYGLGLKVLISAGVDPVEAQAVLFLVFFGTGLFHYGTYDSSFSHVYSAFGSAILVRQLLRLRQSSHERRARGSVALSAGVTGFMILFRNTNALIVLFFAALVALSRAPAPGRRRLLFGAAVGTAIGGAIQLAYNYYASGHFSLTSYLNESFVWDRPMVGSVLFSYERGLFTYYPVLLFGLIVGLARRPSRPYASALGVLTLVYATLYGFWHSWFLGGGFGHRGFVELVPWMVPAIGLALADIPDRTVRRRILLCGALTLFVPLQVMFAYWRGSFPFENVGRDDFWAHVTGGLFGAWAIAAGIGVFAATDRLQRWWSARAAPSMTARLFKADAAGGQAWPFRLRVAIPAAVFALAFVVRVRGIGGHFWMLGDQIRDWGIALKPLQDLPLVGPPTHVGGYTIGPAFYWILWLIRVLFGPWFQNLPHGGGIGQAALQSLVDAFFTVAVWKRTRSVWLALAAVLLLVTAPFDLALAPVIWNPVVGSILAKAAIAFVLLDWHRGSLGRTAAVAAVAWSAVHAYTGALFVALGVLAALVAEEAVRGDWRAVWRRGVVIAAVVAALQLPYLLYQFGPRPHGAAMGAVTSSLAGVVSGGEALQIGSSAAYYADALTSIQGRPWPAAATAWLLLACGALAAFAHRRDASLLCVILLPQVLAVVGYGFWLGGLDSYYYLSLMPAPVLTVLLGATAMLPRRAMQLAAAALLAVVVAAVPQRIRAADTQFKMPTYRALVVGSREIVKRRLPMREVVAGFELHPTTDPAFVYRILGGRIDGQAEWRAEIERDGRVRYAR